MEQIGIERFLELAQSNPVLDVRSPGEFAHAHFPGAYSLPLFSDEERKVVGTAYKQQSREQAIKLGLDYFGGKMRGMVEQVEQIIGAFAGAKSGAVLVHCWRGGMRSAGVSWLLNLYGFKVYTLKGGYKAFRSWALRQFGRSYDLRVLGGYTGSGKTEVLKTLAATAPVIDLEGLAGHKGSAFGGLGEDAQPGQEMFENRLAIALHSLSRGITGQPVWIEDESRRIGNVNIPSAFWEIMRAAPVSFLSVPFDERLGHICATYGKHKQEELINAVVRIKKRLGGADTKSVLNYIVEDNYTEAFRILLTYYDRFYNKDIAARTGAGALPAMVPCDKADAKANAIKLIKQLQDGSYTRN